MADIDWTRDGLAVRKEYVLAGLSTDDENVRLLGAHNVAAGYGEAVMALEADGILSLAQHHAYPVDAGGSYVYRLTEKGRVARAMLRD